MILQKARTCLPRQQTTAARAVLRELELLQVGFAAAAVMVRMRMLLCS